MFNKFFAAAAMMACVALVSQTANAQIGPGNYPNQLFSQYTTQGAGGLTAGQYIAPHPVPAHVGHGYRTYEALMPHEMLYAHDRNYFNYYNDNSYYGGGPALNVTSVRWQSSFSGFRPLPLSNQYLAKLQYRLASRVYDLGGGRGQLRDRLPNLRGGGEQCSTCAPEIVPSVVSDGCAVCGGN